MPKRVVIHWYRGYHNDAYAHVTDQHPDIFLLREAIRSIERWSLCDNSVCVIESAYVTNDSNECVEEVVCQHGPLDDGLDLLVVRIY